MTARAFKNPPRDPGCRQAVVTATITGPDAYLQPVSGKAIDGVAGLNFSELSLTAPGTYTLNVTGAGVSSPPLTITVEGSTSPAPDFGIMLAAGLSSSPVAPGATASFTLTLTPNTAGFPGVISFTAMGLPAGATYTFSPSTVTLGFSPANTVLTVQTADSTAMIRGLGGCAGLVVTLLALPFSLSRMTREKLNDVGLLSFAGVLILLGGSAGLTGCGASSGFFGQAVHSYIVTVTATSSGFPSQSTTVVLNMQ